MANCNETAVFFAEWDRMCKMYDAVCKCEFINSGITVGCSFCEENVRRQIPEAIKIMQQWSDEHPVKTRQSEFLEHYPNAKMRDGGVLTICPMMVDTTYVCVHVEKDCSDCEREYWFSEVD